MKSHPYDVVLLPPSEISHKAIELSQSLASKFPLEFVLDGKTKYPHLTLFQIEVLDSNYPNLKKTVKEIFRTQAKIPSKIVGFSNHETFIFMDVFRSKLLDNLHGVVVKRLNPIRDGLKVSVVLKAFDHFGLQQQKELTQYGAIGVLRNFHPHVTITRLKTNGNYSDAIKSLKREYADLSSIEFDFDKAALGKLSDHGTVVEILESHNLS